MTDFQSLSLSDALLQGLQELQYKQPTPIQQQVIPLIIAGKDVVGQAETGSGKTAAYGLPLLQKTDTQLNQVQGLVIVPTRELALQVREEFKKLGKFMGKLKVSAIYGGHSFQEEKSSFSTPSQVLIATPGRLLDHLQRGTFQPNFIKYFVIDEADKLLDLNFEEEMQEILKYLPAKRQSLLFSATFNKAVQALVRKSLSNPVSIRVEVNAVPGHIEQAGIRVEEQQKPDVLHKLLLWLNTERIIVFCNTRNQTEEVTLFLKKKGFFAEALHGALEQIDRDKAMTKFRNGSVQVLVATDLAARGIDIADLNVVIHFEVLPEEVSFLHRSGRTGRAGKSGNVYTLLTSEEEKYLQNWKETKITQWLDWKKLFSSKSSASAAPFTPATTTLHINAGKKEKLSPRDIVGALVAEAGLQANEIGKIEVHDHFSYVAVPKDKGKEIAEKLNNGKIKGKRSRVSLVK